MKRRDVMTAGIWAAGTMMLALGLLYPVRMLAVDTPKPLEAENARPKLVVDGVELSVVMEGQKGASEMLKAGPSPALCLLASNPTDKAVELKCRVSLSMSPPVELWTRVALAQKEIWHSEQLLTLKAGESKTVKLETDADLVAGSNGSVHLQAGKQQIVAMNVAVPKPKVKDSDGKVPSQPVVSVKR